jgi:hypothetical protein
LPVYRRTSNPATPGSQCGLPTRPLSHREKRAIPAHFGRWAFVSAHRFRRNSRQARPKSPTVIQNIPKFYGGSAETKFDLDCATAMAVPHVTARRSAPPDGRVAKSYHLSVGNFFDPDATLAMSEAYDKAIDTFTLTLSHNLLFGN